MVSVLARFRGFLACALCATLGFALLALGSSATATAKRGNTGTAKKGKKRPEPRPCGSFAHQAEAQSYFIARGGSPEHRVGRLDPDHNGVACESLPGPYAGYATIGYNRRRAFFYGTVTMPRTGGEEPFPCLTGNTHFVEGARLYNVYRVTGKGSHRLFKSYGLGAGVRAASGRLVWRADRRDIPRGLYYVEFEERVRTSPYAETECPSFNSQVVRLP